MRSKGFVLWLNDRLLSRGGSLAAVALFASASLAHCEQPLILPLSGARFDFIWIPVDAPGGVQRVEIGDFGGLRPKERRRTANIYAPFERGGQRGYYLGKTEVTGEQWAAVMGEGPKSKLPVTGKMYSEVQVFLDKLNGLLQPGGEIPRTPDGACGVVKLPTEAEWEYAARGGDGPRYRDEDPYGGDVERYEVFSTPGSDGKAKEAGTRPPNAFGLHDMLGNVRELMEEKYSLGGMSGGGQLLKGGSYLSERSEMRSSARTEQARSVKRPDAGLRLAISAELNTSLGSAPPVVVPEESAKPKPAPEAAATREQPYINGLGMKFVPVPGTGVLFSVWDTRVQDFRVFAEATGYRQSGGIYVWTGSKWELDRSASWESPGFAQGEDHPVVGVSWEEAKEFCRWLTEKERREGKIGAEQEYRLPSDAEWSVAVGGGKYPWGDRWPPPRGAGNYAPSLGVDSYEYTSPCGALGSNELGLCDMGGNVWQWCEDWYRSGMNDRDVLEKYPNLKDDGGGQKYRVVRGASWDFAGPEALRSSYRGVGFPGVRSTCYGFRCVLVGGSSR